MSFPQHEIHNAPPSSATLLEARPERESSGTHFAFLVHSRDTFDQPPSVDNKPLARQRRKRTSPEDQLILEVEFQRDPKPDRAARQAIVDRVALGDKEVQIWFQNRRQSKRRKSQPPVSYHILPRLQPAEPYCSPTQHDDIDSEHSSLPNPASSYGESGVITTPVTSQSPTNSSSQLPANADTQEQDSQHSDTASKTSTMSSSPVSCSKSEPHHVPYQAPSESADVSLSQEFTNQRSTCSEDAGSQTGDSFLKMRLSLTSDGGAKIIQGKDLTPSPPKSQPIAPTPFHTRQALRRSYSNADLAASGDKLPNLSRLLQRKPSGHSRDSRAWEFWCDHDARNELIVKAHKDTTGSAAEAIRLIRSNSSSRKSNSFSSDFRRSGSLDTEHDQRVAKKMKKTPVSTRLHEEQYSTSGSDKENRSPAYRDVKYGKIFRLASTTPHSSTHEARFTGHQIEPIFGYGKIGLGICSNQSNASTDLSQRSNDGGDDNGDDDEVARFMAGSRSFGVMKNSHMDKIREGADDEMDCVAGLLSLSQGNWD